MSQHSIRFDFNVKKAAQAAGLILKLSKGKRNYMERLQESHQTPSWFAMGFWKIAH
ncbi:MAG TPA: hypothetical protein VGO59_09670 [Verrucomicrobiae bacterium]|jgi:hypothetical protein